MAARTRSEYRGATSVDAPSTERGVELRPVTDGDRSAIASLLLDAYRGTIDDEGEGEPEALAAADFYLGSIVRGCSVVAESQGALVAISFVVVVGEVHFIDPVATAATMKRQGVGRRAVSQSLALLAERGVDEVRAVITDGNVGSEALFVSLGFRRVGSWGSSA